MIYGLLGPSQVVHDFVQRYQQDSPYRFPPTLQQAPCWPFPDSRIPCIVQQLDFGQGHLWEIVPLWKFFKVHNMEGQDWGSFPTFPQIFPSERQRGWESVDLVVFFLDLSDAFRCSPYIFIFAHAVLGMTTWNQAFEIESAKNTHWPMLHRIIWLQRSCWRQPRKERSHGSWTGICCLDCSGWQLGLCAQRFATWKQPISQACTCHTQHADWE